MNKDGVLDLSSFSGQNDLTRTISIVCGWTRFCSFCTKLRNLWTTNSKLRTAIISKSYREETRIGVDPPKMAQVTVCNADMVCFYKKKKKQIPVYSPICKAMLWNIQGKSGIACSSHHWRQYLRIFSLSATTREWEGSHMMN